MVRIVLSLLCTYQSSCSTTVMAVSDVESWHLSELLCDGLDVSIVGNNPELMAESVNRRNKVVLRLTSGIAHNQLVEHSIVRICEEHRLDVSVINANMLHAVFLLVAACQLMLLDGAVHIVVNESTNHKTILCLAVHGLSVDIVRLLLILTKPSLILELLEVLSSLLVHSGVVLACARLKVDFRLYNVVKALFVIASLSSCLFAVENIIRT